MTPTTLALIKAQLKRLYKVYEPLAEYHSHNATTSHQYTVASILLQNMQFDGKNCVGYDYKEEVQKLDIISNILKELAEYHKQDHTIQYIYDEVRHIIEGEEMTEVYEDERKYDSNYVHDF